jgi:methylmalonyl-CoA mutase
MKPSHCPTDFSASIARNTQLYLEKVTGITRLLIHLAVRIFLKVLTGSLLEKAWDLIQQVEELGGMAKGH